MSRFFALTLLVSFVLLGASAFGVDGTMLINQNTSVNGLPGCPHSGFPIQICQPGSYKLSGNLVAKDLDTDVIQITASNVTLDLNGFSITGANVCTRVTSTGVTCSSSGAGNGVAVIGTDLSGLVIQNGTISGMGLNGISAAGMTARIERVQAYSNGSNGVELGSGTASNVIALRNAGNGISLSVGTVLASTSEFNNESGIVLGSGRMEGCVAHSNRSYGLTVNFPAVISHNDSQFNGGSGLFIGRAGVMYDHNILLNNSGGAIAPGITSFSDGTNVCTSSTQC